jgi:Arc/MetJ-type ribon-helix-helix transcriptional regulator
MTGKKAVSKCGKNVNLYLYDADVARIRELVSYVASNGLRVSESLVVRTALRVAQADQRFLTAYVDAASADQRFKDES